MDELEITEDQLNAEGETKPPQNKPRKAKRQTVRLSKNEIDYAKSRKKYLQHLAASPSTMLFSLDASSIKVGFSNRGTQYKLDKFSQASQTDQIKYTESGIQIPDVVNQQRFPSLVHFLKAATSTVMALLDQSQFGVSKSMDKQIVRLNKYTTDTVPVYVQITASRTYALICDPAPLGRIIVWTATNSQPAFHLISSASPSCFALYKDGQYIVAGTESGSLLIWDLARVEKTKQSGTALVVQPQSTTDSMGIKNHRFPIVTVSVFGAAGTVVVCALDVSSVVSFWYIRTSGNDISFIKAETVKLSAGFLPSYTLAMVPGSVNSFIVGCGGKIFNCCRFGSATSPSIFSANAAVKVISFNPILTQFFAASCDNGKIGIYNMHEASSVLEICVNLSLGDTGAVWSPTRASVLFVSDLTGMRIYIYDLMVSTRMPVFVYKVGSAAQSIALAKSSNGVILAVAEGGLAVTVYNVDDKLSQPLTDTEVDQFKRVLFNSK